MHRGARSASLNWLTGRRNMFVLETSRSEEELLKAWKVARGAALRGMVTAEPQGRRAGS